MTIKVSEEVLDNSWANGEQGIFPDEGMLVSEMVSWEGIEEEQQTFSKSDFERALRKSAVKSRSSYLL